MILGVADPKEAWKCLERRFGDRNIIIITARQKLLATNMKGSPYEQLETLCQSVELAETTLRAVNRMESLFDIATVSILANKLPTDLQNRWIFHRSELKDDLLPAEQGAAFKLWLDKARRAANTARIQQLGVELSQKAEDKPNNACTSCGKHRHKANTCPTNKDTSSGVFAAHAAGLSTARKRWET